MRVSDIMTTDVVTVSRETSFKEVVDLLVRSGISGVPVVDDDARVVGLITEADCISKEAYADGRRHALSLLADVLSGRDHRWVGKIGAATAAEVMTVNPMVCSPDDDVHAVARRMLESRIKRLPVVQGGRLVGIVARHDILGIFDRPDSAIAADAKRLLEDSNMFEDHGVKVAVHEGVVTMTGEVRYEGDMKILASMMGEIPGVVKVASDLRWRETRAPGHATSEPERNEAMKQWTFRA